MRLDLWLWAVRIFKSRSIAAETVKCGRVDVNGHPAKPAHEVRPGETVLVRSWDRERAVRVLGIPESRVGAKLVAQFAEDCTAELEHITVRHDVPQR
jgi:ribosome-associated heat shock protein Hsp15